MINDIYEQVWMATSSKYRAGIQELRTMYNQLMAEPCKCVPSSEYEEYVEIVKDHMDDGDNLWVVRNPFKGNPKSYECPRCNGIAQIWELIKGE